MTNNPISIDIIIDSWIDLLLKAKASWIICNEKEPFDEDTFVGVMQESYQYFFSNGRKDSLNQKEITAYGFICAYSQLPSLGSTEDDLRFNASTLAAELFAISIRDPDEKYRCGTALIRCIGDWYYSYGFDIEIGDLSDFMYSITKWGR